MGAYVLKHGGHVNVDILYGRFSPRIRAIIDLFTWLLFFYFCGLLLVKGWEMAWDSFVVAGNGTDLFCSAGLSHQGDDSFGGAFDPAAGIG